ncbi:MAG TPA: C-type lectin domain-containing protein [Polyangiales bacterium]|nr:C-type lectin domain-containing protein [Polyangiales bacterium]
MQAAASSRIYTALVLATFALCFTACGRLGYELHDLDAGSDQNASRILLPRAGNGRSGGGVQAGTRAAPMDASLPPPAATAKSDAGVSQEPPSGADTGAACSGDESCASGACVTGVCCESHCDQPPPCYVAAAVSCELGQCHYRAVSGEACDDGNSCTKADHCDQGVCIGQAQCDDDNACTQDFCGTESCAHASSCQPDDPTCSYAERSGHGYWLCPGPVDFDTAHKECKRIGAQLVTINDEREQQALWLMGMRDSWIGYRATNKDPDAADAGFAWVDGKSDFEAWADSDLDAGVADRCAFQAATEQGAWQARACDQAFSGFACEVEQYAVPEATCRYQRRASHGYFSCESERTWIEAQQRCADSGAYLVEPDNAEEHAFILSLLKAAHRYAIGVTDARHEGELATTRGGRLAFSAWDKAEPSNASAELDYAVLQASGTWQTVGPSQRAYYICEQDR